MNIEINDDNRASIEEMCEKMNLTPSQLVVELVSSANLLYPIYEKEGNKGIEKRVFEQIQQDLFKKYSKKQSFNSKLITLHATDQLIESTNRLIGIRSHTDACIFDINPDFDKRSISYIVSYDFCVDCAHTNKYTALVIEVEINQDYIEVSQLVFLPIPESVAISGKHMSKINGLIQEYIKEKYGKELIPSTNISLKLRTMRSNPFNPIPDIHQYIAMKLTVKADKAIHIPHIEKMAPIMKSIQVIVQEKLLAL
ncbi:MAG TPA: hypothetical protein VIP70_09125 [Nitrososphaeraceae archaeon]